MENGPDLPIKMVVFHSYVALPEGNRVFFFLWAYFMIYHQL